MIRHRIRRTRWVENSVHLAATATTRAIANRIMTRRADVAAARASAAASQDQEGGLHDGLPSGLSGVSKTAVRASRRLSRTRTASAGGLHQRRVVGLPPLPRVDRVADLISEPGDDGVPADGGTARGPYGCRPERTGRPYGPVRAAAARPAGCSGAGRWRFRAGRG